MYDALVEACVAAEADASVHVLIIRGADGAFSAGTDISQFRDFASGDDGVAYERRLDAVVDRIEQVKLATIAEVDGPAVGGGCAIAVACDVRLCSDRAKFGVPVSRTLGNCLSMANTARMADLIGPALTRDLLLTGRLIGADEALQAGLVAEVVSADELSSRAMALAADLSTRARSTVIATKQMLQRLRDHRRPPAGAADDIIRACYASTDFKQRVAEFLRR
jgi:enoyl-CoA hydratase/carnithine racemase